MNEAETRAELIDPALKDAGWASNLGIPAPLHAGVAYGMAMNQPPPAQPPQIPVRLQRYDEGATPPRRRYWLHPTSGLLILGVDWLFFAPEAATAEFAAIVTSPLAFLITSIGVFWIQRRKNQDTLAAAALKAVLSGIVAGIPTSIGGTILGTAVLLLSGLSKWNQRRDGR